MCNWRYAVHRIQLVWESLSEKTKQNKNLKGMRQTQKIILGGGYQHGHKKVKIN